MSNSERGRAKKLPVITCESIKGKVSDPLPCWKVRYESERAALSVASDLPIRAYRCMLCGAWHRTENVRRKKGVTK